MGSPPPVGLKKFVPTIRSNDSKIIAPAKTGVAISARNDVASIAQQNKGIWFSPIPGIRILKIVTMKFTAAKIEDVPNSKTLRIQIISPGLPFIKLRGG